MDGSDPVYVFSSFTSFRNPSIYELSSNIDPSFVIDLQGSFTYDDNSGNLTGGVVTSAVDFDNGIPNLTITGVTPGIDAQQLISLLTTDQNFLDIWQLVLTGGNDMIQGGNGGPNHLYGFGGHDAIVGSAGNDLLVEFGGNSWLSGGPGNDRLVDAGVGNDTFVGGPGADRFVFRVPPAAMINADTIVDLSHAQGDRIVLSETYFPGLGPLGTLRNSHFRNGHAVNGNASVVYMRGNGDLYYAPHGNHHPIEMFHFATLSSHPVLYNTDFIVVS
jgi:Ca2+-binding RTX toxin-like protein